MSLFEMFVNKDPLRRQRDRAKDFAREAYNPNVFNEAINVAREQGVEGISQGVEDLSRSKTLQSLFRERDMGLYGGNVGAAIAGTQAGDTAARTAMAGFEADMAIADEQARQAGRQQYGQLATQQGQVLSQQKAAMEEADLMYQAEVDARTQKIKGTALQLGLVAATLPFGGGGSLLSRGLGALASGGVGKVATDLAGETVASGVDAVGSTIDSFTDMGTFADQLGSIPQQPPTEVELPQMETAGLIPYAEGMEPIQSPFGADESIPDVVPSTQQFSPTEQSITPEKLRSFERMGIIQGDEMYQNNYGYGSPPTVDRSLEPEELALSFEDFLQQESQMTQEYTTGVASAAGGGISFDPNRRGTSRIPDIMNFFSDMFSGASAQERYQKYLQNQ